MEAIELAKVYNYIYIDDTDGLPMEAFPFEGTYIIAAHEKTYQKSPAAITAKLEAGKCYCLGAEEVFIGEREFE